MSDRKTFLTEANSAAALRQSNAEPKSVVARLQSSALKWGRAAIDETDASEANLTDGIRPPARLMETTAMPKGSPILSEYKDIVGPWNNWRAVQAQCASLAAVLISSPQ